MEFNLDLKEQQDKKTNPVLLRAVNNPEFVPRACQQSGALNPIPSSSFSASAVHAPEFVPGKPFLKYEEIQDERIKSIKRFVTDKTRQVMDDPGLLEEISTSMANYLSLFIKVEADLKTVSDLLFETVRIK